MDLVSKSCDMAHVGGAKPWVTKFFEQHSPDITLFYGYIPFQETITWVLQYFRGIPGEAISLNTRRLQGSKVSVDSSIAGTCPEKLVTREAR